MSQATTEPTTPTTGDVLARVGETLAALQDAEQTCVEAARKLYEHTQDGNAHGAGLQENIGREMPLPVWQGTALAFQKTDGTLEAVDLKGEKGDRGEAGPRPEHRWDGTRLTVQSADGSWPENGVDLKGEKGDKGEIGPRPEHRWDGTRLTVQNADGSWPESGVDLKGEKGDTGEVTLSDAVDSNSGTTAASSKAVKTAYDAAIFAQKQVKTKLTQPTTFYVNGETGNDALDEGRGLSADKPFLTVQAAVNHVCGGYDLDTFDGIIYGTENTYPETVTIPPFMTLTGKLRFRGDGQDKTIISGSFITKHSSGSIVFEDSLRVQCPETPTPGYKNAWYGVASFSTGLVEIACTIDAGTKSSSIAKACVSGSQIGGELSLGKCTLTGDCTNFLYTNGATISIGDDITIQGSINDGAVAVASNGGNIIAFAKEDGSFPQINGEGTTGIRYVALKNGCIDTGGQGPHFFPGSEDGIVDEATGGVYD